MVAGLWGNVPYLTVVDPYTAKAICISDNMSANLIASNSTRGCPPLDKILAFERASHLSNSIYSDYFVSMDLKVACRKGLKNLPLKCFLPCTE